MKTLATIGYEGATVGDFIHTLKLTGITQVIDIRELPQSRRPGFSKNLLANALLEANIQYTHFKALGDPKHGREAARAGRIEEFRQIFSAHMDRPDALLALNVVADLARNSSSVLLCYERDPRNCHRSMVADRLDVLYTFQISHLGVKHGSADRAVIQSVGDARIPDSPELHNS